MNRSIYQRCYIFLTVFLIMSGFIQAQGGPTPMPDTLVYTLGSIPAYSLYWWDDQLFFTDLTSDEKEVFRYTPATNELTQVDSYPLTVALTGDQQAHYRAFSDWASVSPSGDVFLYVSQFDTYTPAEGGGWPRLYAVGQFPLSTESRGGVYFPLRIPIFFAPDTLFWSENSSSFVLLQASPYGGIANLYYVELEWQQGYLFDIEEIYIGQTYIGRYVYDISADGERVLFSNSSDQVVLWDSRVPVSEDAIDAMSSALPIGGEHITSAAFIHGDDQHVLILNNEGIARYNLDTSETTIVTNEVTSAWAKAALFSPDNHYLAVLTGDGGIAFPELHVLALDNLLADFQFEN
jgi:hypothetical protein